MVAANKDVPADMDNQKTVLIVDDEPETAEMLAEMLRLIGYRTVKSYGGAASINLVSKERPDAVLLDMVMPDISGIDILRYVRRDPQLLHIPVVVVSARCLPSDIKTGMEAGASAYLAKPVSFNDLTLAVEQAIQATHQT